MQSHRPQCKHISDWCNYQSYSDTILHIISKLVPRLTQKQEENIGFTLKMLTISVIVYKKLHSALNCHVKNSPDPGI